MINETLLSIEIDRIYNSIDRKILELDKGQEYLTKELISIIASDAAITMVVAKNHSVDEKVTIEFIRAKVASILKAIFHINTKGTIEPTAESIKTFTNYIYEIQESVMFNPNR